MPKLKIEFNRNCTKVKSARRCTEKACQKRLLIAPGYRKVVANKEVESGRKYTEEAQPRAGCYIAR